MDKKFTEVFESLINRVFDKGFESPFTMSISEHFCNLYEQRTEAIQSMADAIREVAIELGEKQNGQG